MSWIRQHFFGLIKREKGLIYTTIGNAGSAVLGAFFWLILASILSVSGYGEVNYYIAIASILSAFGLLGLNTTVTTYLAKGDDEITYEANSLVFLSSIALAAVTIQFRWIPLILVATTFYSMALAEILGKKLYREYALVSILSRSAQIVLSILFYLRFGLTGILMGYFLGPLLLSYRYLRSLSRFTLRMKGIRDRMNFAAHSYGFGLIGSFSGFLDKIIIGTLFGFHSLGLYQLGFQFLMFLGIIPASLSSYLLPEESSGEERGEVKLIGLIISAVAAVLTFMAAPWIVKSFFPNFIDAIQTVQIMCLAVVPATVASLSNARLFGRERSRHVFIGGIIYLGSLISGLLLLGRTMGITGLALSVVLAQALQAVYLWSMAADLRKMLKKSRRNKGSYWQFKML